MLNVLDRCLSIALATAARPAAMPRTRAVLARQHSHAHLASYPRLRQAIERAEADGVFRQQAR